MILSRRVALNGIQLDELHERIVIRSFDPGVPHETVSSVNRMGGAGQRMTEQHWDSLEATVRFAIDLPKREMAERRAVLDAVNAWALRKGWLTANGLPEKRMYAEKVVVPGSGDLWEWTSEYSIIFRAYGVPFWQDDTAVSVENANITRGNVAISVPGHVKTVLDVSFRNISGLNIPNISFTAGANTLTLNGVNIGANQTLKIYHDNTGLLHAERGGTSVYHLITGSDDLYVNPGTAQLAVNATRAGRMTISCYGRYV